MQLNIAFYLQYYLLNLNYLNYLNYLDTYSSITYIHLIAVINFYQQL